MISSNVIIKKMISAPREAVFNAFSKPEIMQQWFYPNPDWHADVSNEFKVGGRYQLVMHTDDDVDITHTGEYKKIIPNEEIVFTWSSNYVENTLVTLKLADADGKTEVTLTHELLPTEELRKNHEHGWTGCLANLGNFLSKDDFSLYINLQAPIEKVYAAVTTEKGLQGWWTETCHAEEKVGGKAKFEFGESHNTMQIMQLEPNQRVTWKCIDQHHVGKDLTKNDEWVGKNVQFLLKKNTRNKGGTDLIFIHEGMNSQLECYERCFAGWNYFMTSLRSYVETGKGTPYSEANAVCAADRK